MLYLGLTMENTEIIAEIDNNMNILTNLVIKIDFAIMIMCLLNFIIKVKFILLNSYYNILF